MRPYITVTHGMSGYFAILTDGEEVIQSGIGRYETSTEAQYEALEWATSEELEYK